MRIFLSAALLCAVAIQTVSAQDDLSIRRRIRGEGVHIRIARSYYLPADQIVSRPVIVIGGSATIDGRVEDDLVVIGGRVRIGPTAQVHASVVSVGGDVTVADGAQVTGEIQDVSIIWPELRFALREWFGGVDEGWWAMFSFVGTLFRLTLVMLAACLLALIAPRWIRRIERIASTAPMASGVLGVTMEVMFVPLLVIAVIGLVITIIGIPLLLLVPFVVFGFMVTWLAGFAGVAAQIGGRLRARGRNGSVDSPVIDTAFGVALLGLVTMIGNVLALGPPVFTPLAAAFSVAGVVIEYLAWTVGLGAALLAPFQARWRATPPPIPAPASAHAPA
jgi:hypothetical protein